MKEIKASDLRIGNLVRLFVGINDEGANYREYEIKGVMKMYNSSHYLLDNTWIEISNNLEPIPLTEEWLVRLGFYVWKCGNETHIWLAARHKLNIEFTINNAYKEWRFTPVWCTDYKPILFVHQLQNLYYALTGEELTLKTQ